VLATPARNHSTSDSPGSNLTEVEGKTQPANRTGGLWFTPGVAVSFVGLNRHGDEEETILPLLVALGIVRGAPKHPRVHA